MTAEEAGKFIAGFIDCTWPRDKKKIFDIIRLGLNKAWQEGKWLGMTAEFFPIVEKDEDGRAFVLAPASHPILLACNKNNKKATLRDNYFLFHKNGMGDVKNYPGCAWQQDNIFDVGYTPIINELNVKFSGGVMIGVRAIGQPGPNEFVNIDGKHLDGERIYSYRNREFGEPCGCKINKQEVETINGIRLDITEKFNYISNIKFGSIASISKSITRTPIEIIAVDSTGDGKLIARLEPNQRRSKYRKYMVPQSLCANTCIHGLFKIGQQEEITQETDVLMIDNQEALLCFCKGVHYIYYKEEPEVGAAYVLQGISILEKEKREEESPTEFPIQVDMTLMGDIPEGLRYNS